ncbi:hypothetical protein [Pseudogemmobacter bohemicus]|uniref:hypothetical protein n=1 Tax=Pseudogemmobacter bohemicus TaxID=2250708 RepID=UPI000DD4970E|nr:hypothetical protein [Pseudogemmobacter bohemicus]
MKQRVRERLAELAGQRDEAQIPFDQRQPLGRFFDLDPFMQETAQIIGAASEGGPQGEWGAKRLFQKFLYGYEADIEPHYGVGNDQDAAEIDAQRERLRVAHVGYQLLAIAQFSEGAQNYPFIYDLVVRYLNEIDDSEFQIDPKVRSAFRKIVQLPRPQGASGAKKATNVIRDLIIIDLVSDLIKTFEGLPVTFSRAKLGNENACDIVTAVWDEEFKYIKRRHGTSVVVIDHRLNAESAVRNVWEKRNKKSSV